MSSPGITSINSGPLVLRTNHSSLVYNTYALGEYDIPISSNRLFITSTSGRVVTTDSIYVSSISTSALSVSTINGMPYPPLDDAFWSGDISGDIYNDNTGNVGIGTQTPNALLDINNNVAFTLRDVLNVTSNNNNFTVLNSTDMTYNYMNVRIQNNQDNSSASPLEFVKTKNYGTTDDGSEIGYISFNGINTSLNVASGPRIIAKQDGIISTCVPSELCFYTATSSSRNLTMVLSKDTNVGIGTPTPYNKLQVQVTDQDALTGITATSADVNTIIGAYSEGAFLGDNVGSIQGTSNNMTYTPHTLAINPRGGDVYIGSTTYNTHIESISTFTNNLKPTTIIDSTNSIGTSGQLLSATGSGISWSSPSISLTAIPFNILNVEYPAGSSDVTGSSFPLSVTQGKNYIVTGILVFTRFTSIPLGTYNVPGPFSATCQLVWVGPLPVDSDTDVITYPPTGNYVPPAPLSINGRVFVPFSGVTGPAPSGVTGVALRVYGDDNTVEFSVSGYNALYLIEI
jgi:hypothetical protein